MELEQVGQLHTSASGLGKNEESVQDVTLVYNASLSLKCSHLKLVPKNSGKEGVWGFKPQRVGEAPHPGPVVSRVATLNVDGFDEPTWFMVREWMVDEGVDALHGSARA